MWISFKLCVQVSGAEVINSWWRENSPTDRTEGHAAAGASDAQTRTILQREISETRTHPTGNCSHQHHSLLSFFTLICSPSFPWTTSWRLIGRSDVICPKSWCLWDIRREDELSADVCRSFLHVICSNEAGFHLILLMRDEQMRVCWSSWAERNARSSADKSQQKLKRGLMFVLVLNGYSTLW